jgi:hypothetical protein
VPVDHRLGKREQRFPRAVDRSAPDSPGRARQVVSTREPGGHHLAKLVEPRGRWIRRERVEMLNECRSNQFRCRVLRLTNRQRIGESAGAGTPSSRREVARTGTGCRTGRERGFTATNLIQPIAGRSLSFRACVLYEYLHCGLDRRCGVIGCAQAAPIPTSD